MSLTHALDVPTTPTLVGKWLAARLPVRAATAAHRLASAASFAFLVFVCFSRFPVTHWFARRFCAARLAASRFAVTATNCSSAPRTLVAFGFTCVRR